eukprot:3001906-Lingulodinium_polyedra.AAC.1
MRLRANSPYARAVLCVELVAARYMSPRRCRAVSVEQLRDAHTERGSGRTNVALTLKGAKGAENATT